MVRCQFERYQILINYASQKLMQHTLHKLLISILNIMHNFLLQFYQHTA